MDDYEKEEICRRFGFYRKRFELFLDDYCALPYAELPPWPDDPVELSFQNICRQVDLPQNLVRRAQREGVIGTPVTESDLDALKAVRQVFGKAWFIRAQLLRFNKQERESLIRRQPLKEWEKFAYENFLRGKMSCDGEGAAQKGGRLYITPLMKTIELRFQIPVNKQTKQRLLQVRKLASNDLFSAKKRGVALASLAKKRGVNLD